MFQCAWCKKENIDPSAWSEYKEPICNQCEYKYRIAKEQNMFSGKVSELTKEQRREISSNINHLTQFVQAIRLIKKEKLTGKFKVTSNVIAGILIVFLFVPTTFSDSFNRFLDSLGFIGAFYFYIYSVIALILFTQINWWLKFLQLRSKAKRIGFSL